MWRFHEKYGRSGNNGGVVHMQVSLKACASSSRAVAPTPPARERGVYKLYKRHNAILQTTGGLIGSTSSDLHPQNTINLTPTKPKPKTQTPNPKPQTIHPQQARGLAQISSLAQCLALSYSSKITIDTGVLYGCIGV